MLFVQRLIEYAIFQYMEIVYLGHSSFRLKGKQASVVTDPYGASFGKFPREIEADIVTISHGHPDHNEVKNVKGTPFVIDGPGEYEVKDVSVVGVHTFHDSNEGADRGVNTVYVIEMDGLRIAHLGDLGHKLSESQLSEIGPIDIVMVPTGGQFTIDAKTATEVVRQVDPWIVIPMHYQQEGITLPSEVSGVEVFMKESGKEAPQPLPKLVISADKLPTELQIVLLDRKS